MLNIVKLKGCKRCSGDLFVERDIEGTYIFCLQCGAVYIKHAVLPAKGARAKKVLAATH
jgi:hypothetical protein